MRLTQGIASCGPKPHNRADAAMDKAQLTDELLGYAICVGLCSYPQPYPIRANYVRLYSISCPGAMIVTEAPEGAGNIGGGGVFS